MGKINMWSQPGTYHWVRHQENQDVVHKLETSELLAIMLADGATACKRGREGAQFACDAAAQVIRYDGAAFFRNPESKISYLLMEQILYVLECRKPEGEDIHEYGSTFLMAVLEKASGRLTMLNLGDGAILTTGEQGLSWQLRPKRIRGATCLTTTKGASGETEVRSIHLNQGESAILCSDGFLTLEELPYMKQKLLAGDFDGLDRLLASADRDDDCSYIALTRTERQRKGVHGIWRGINEII